MRVLEVAFIEPTLSNNSDHWTFFYWGSFSLYYSHEHFLFKTSCSCPYFRDYKNPEWREKEITLKISLFLLKKKKTPKIKPPKFWTVRRWKRNYCSKSICTASCNYSANSRKPCLKAQSLFLTLSCYWAWGWTKRWQIHGEVWIFLFSLNSFPFRAGGQLLESKLHAPNWWLELLLVTIFFFSCLCELAFKAGKILYFSLVRCL